MKKLRQIRPIVFVLAAIAAGSADYLLLTPNLHVVSLYTLFIVASVAVVHYRFREKNRPLSVPLVRPLPAKTQPALFGLTEIIRAEFDYIKETAAQAMDDRHTMVNYFLLSAGVLLAAMGLMVSEQGAANFPYRYQTIIALSLTFNAIGWIYFMQIIRLRQAWCESARAMSHLKQFWLQHSEFPAVAAGEVFRWKPDTLPAAGKKMTVFYLSALLISVLNAGALVLAATLLSGIQLDTSGATPAGQTSQFLLVSWRYFAICLGAGFFHLLFQMSMYSDMLSEADNVATASTQKPTKISKKDKDIAKPASGRPMNVEIIEEKLVFDDFFRITRARLRFEKYDGTLSEIVPRLCLDRGDAVAVVLYNRRNKSLILIEQFRYPVYRAQEHRGGWFYELVAGTVNAGESPEEVARREVLEETGYRVVNIKSLQTIYPSPGGISERIHLYFAEIAGRENSGGGLATEHEDIRILELPVSAVYNLLQNGDLQDAKTIIGLMLVKEENLLE